MMDECRVMLFSGRFSVWLPPADKTQNGGEEEEEEEEEKLCVVGCCRMFGLVVLICCANCVIECVLVGVSWRVEECCVALLFVPNVFDVPPDDRLSFTFTQSHEYEDEFLVFTMPYGQAVVFDCKVCKDTACFESFISDDISVKFCAFMESLFFVLTFPLLMFLLSAFLNLS